MPILYSNENLVANQIEGDAFIIVDLEYTSWHDSLKTGWSGKGQYREIVNIGAIKVQNLSSTLRVVDQFDVLVKPKINPVLSEYFINLTGITNDMVAAGLSYENAMQKFLQFSSSIEYFYANGNDYSVIIENLMLNDSQIKCPEIRSIRNLLSKSLGLNTQDTISSELYKFTDMKDTISLRSHSGLDDCISILIAIAHINHKKLELT
ncbi:exonuclease domain-containing protein [Polynucleobacter paneuropaeus]|nr:exonuclease domain-containing protein [Polynucleobacter paneuropaeus]